MRKYLKEGQYSIDEKDCLGSGSFGKVYRGYDHVNSRWVAIKSIDLDCLQKYGDEMKSIICNEITVMRKFTKRMVEKDCPYLVKHYDCFRTDTNVYIVMQLCQGGTLNDYLNAHNLNEPSVRVILQHLLIGLQYLDELNISHRDLKPENIFIAEATVKGKGEAIFKIGDFGFAAQKQTFNEVLGTYPFMAPEIYNRENYTSKVDVWSVGIIAYQLMFKQLYFFGKNKWQIEKKVKENPFVLTQAQKGKISKEMEDFIATCLTKNKELRPKASQILKHPFFVGVKKEYDDSVFEAISCQVEYCAFLRSMAQEICEFGSKLHRKTQFIQMYFLKKAFSIINILTYSILNRKNYLNMQNEAFEWALSEANASKYEELNGKIQKQYILISSLYSSKHQQFSKYISKFSEEQQVKIMKVICHDQIYQDVNEAVYKAELKKWIKVLSLEGGEFETLGKKCQKLYEI